MVYKYNQAKILKTLSFFILICCLSCIELFGQSYVTWTGLNSSSIQGTFPGGTVTVSQSLLIMYLHQEVKHLILLDLTQILHQIN
jgi:hypothetical protein